MSTAHIREVQGSELLQMMCPLPEEQMVTMRECARISVAIWVGFADDDFVCAYGLIPPTLLADRAYIWLYSTPKVEEHTFIFVRHSQRMVEETLKRFSQIVGFCAANNDRAIRWVKWLGGVFAEPENGCAHFCIRRRCHG